MADMPALAAGLPTVEPGRAPAAYQTVRASPEDFGAGVGRAVQGFGAAAQQAAEAGFQVATHFDEVAADDAANQFEAKVQGLLYGGDTPDSTGYMALQGRAALDGRPQVEEQIKAIRQEIAQGLQNARQKETFGRFAEKFGNSVTAKIGAYADRQSVAYAKSVNDATDGLTVTRIAQNAFDEKEVERLTHDLRSARIKNAELSGAVRGDPVWTAALESADRDALITRVNAIAGTDPIEADRIVHTEGNRKILGAAYDELARSVRTRKEQQTGVEAGMAAMERAPQVARPRGAESAEDIAARILAPEGVGPDRSGPGGAPASSAHSGFLAGTWNHIREKNPDSGLPATPADATPEQLNAAAALYAEENAEFLTGAGMEADATALRLAHFLGPKGAIDVLKADPETPVADVLSAAAVAANPQALGGKTAAQVVADAAAVMGGADTRGETAGRPTARSERISALENIDARTDLNPREKAAARAYIKTHFETIAAVEAEEKRARDERQSAFTSTFEIQLNRGEKTYLDIESAWQQGLISDAKRTQFALFLDRKREEVNKVTHQIGRVQAVLENGGVLDPRTEADKKAVDLHYEATAQSWAQLPREEVLPRAIQYAVNVGIVPTPLKQLVRGSLRGTDPAKAVQASGIVKQMRNANPRLLNDFNDQDLTLANLIGEFTDAGVPPTDAFNLANEGMKVPETVRDTRRRTFDLELGADTKSREAKIKSWLEGKLNSLWTPDPTIDPIMSAEFQNLSRLEFEKTGNMDASFQFALDKISRVWARTDVGGAERYMKYAPEKFYGVFTNDPARDAAWMNEQLLTDVTTGALIDPENPITLDRLHLTPDPTKLADDGRPVYQVTVMGPDGLLYVVRDDSGSPMAWRPSWQESKGRADMDASIEERIETLRGRRREQFEPTAPVGVGP